MNSANLIRAAVAIVLLLCPFAPAGENHSIKPVGKDGQPLNLDFETGTLKDWTATGDAFEGQPVRGDTVYPRRHDMHSNHQGQFWIGGFEVKGDDATGTLTSVPFKVTHRWASFLVAGGPWNETRVELVRAGTADSNDVFFRVSGYESETLRPVVVDLKEEMGKEIFLRLVDARKGAWGHINFDDFEFYDQRPQLADELDPKKIAVIDLPPSDQFAHAGVPPKEAPKIMSLPEGFRAMLYAGEPDIVQPIAFTIDQRGRLWVVEGLQYPLRAAGDKGADRILVFEDSKGTGHFDKRTIFYEGLNLVSGIEVGFGGVYIGAAPYLLFIPVSNWDDPKPGGSPQVLLDGFGWHDTHETLNTFSWGPDGWLYGCHGIFTQSFVGKPGTPRSERVHINAGIWRYHPTKHVFERFAEGTSNPWGLDFDQHGQMIIEACVIPHLWHVIQGAHYERQAGQDDNPYVFDDLKTIADHLHWAKAKDPWAANGHSAAVGGGHAHAGMLVYQGNSWPKQFNGNYFMNNIHGARINMDIPEVKGSGFVGHHGKDFIEFNDYWSQIVNLRGDQDGSVYMIDWYDATQCHTTDPTKVDRGNGRIFKIVYGDTKTTQVALDKLSDVELAKLTLDPNDWYVRTARRILQERAAAGKLDPAARKELLDILANNPDETRELRALWALHVTGGVPHDAATAQLARADKPYVQAWTIQLLCENKDPSEDAVREFARLAKQSRSPVVRLYAASACQRSPLQQTWDIVAGLLSHAEDAADHNLPLMDWYALEPLAGTDPERALGLAEHTQLPNILAFTVRRIGAVGDRGAIAALTHSLSRVNDDQRRLEVLGGIAESLRGRRSVPMPDGWTTIEQQLQRSSNLAIRDEMAALSVTFGSQQAIAFERQVLADRTAGPAKREAAMQALLAVKDPILPRTLQGLLADPSMQASALRGLAQYDDPQTPKAIVARFGSFDVQEKKDALNTLASRPSFARELLAAVASGAIPSREVSADLVRQLRNLHDSKLDEQVTKIWGVLRDSPQDKLNRMAELRKIVEGPGPTPDPSHGRMLFTQTCSQCHTLFDTGGHVGPDITGSNRADLSYLLQRVVDPNFLIPNEYRPTIVRTTDDRTIIGIIKKEDTHAITLQTANELITVPRNEIQVQKLSPLGMMPEGLLDAMNPNDIRDLIAYLRSPAQVPLPASIGSAQAVQKLSTAAEGNELFNGKDLTGWWSDRINLWHVEGGELVGKTEKGLPNNEFLKTKKSFGDFRLIVKIKLVPNEGNSGIQFHSKVFEGNEMAGPQADVGKGWWGKLYGENFHNRVLADNKSGEQVVKPNEWNTYEVVAVGTRILTAINGHPCADYDAPDVPKSGLFGLQIHAGGPTEVRFRDFEFEENPKLALKTVHASD